MIATSATTQRTTFVKKLRAALRLHEWRPHRDTHWPLSEIKRLRERHNVRQPLFARYLNTSASTVEKWETGAKRPSGTALKLLAIVQKHGLQVLT